MALIKVVGINVIQKTRFAFFAKPPNAQIPFTPAFAVIPLNAAIDGVALYFVARLRPAIGIGIDTIGCVFIGRQTKAPALATHCHTGSAMMRTGNPGITTGVLIAVGTRIKRGRCQRTLLNRACNNVHHPTHGSAAILGRRGTLHHFNPLHIQQ